MLKSSKICNKDKLKQFKEESLYGLVPNYTSQFFSLRFLILQPAFPKMFSSWHTWTVLMCAGNCENFVWFVIRALIEYVE
jgi:hypothetical protein